MQSIYHKLPFSFMLSRWNFNDISTYVYLYALHYFQKYLFVQFGPSIENFYSFYYDIKFCKNSLISKEMLDQKYLYYYMILVLKQKCLNKNTIKSALMPKAGNLSSQRKIQDIGRMLLKTYPNLNRSLSFLFLNSFSTRKRKNITSRI